MSSYSRFRDWQSEGIGESIFLNAKQQVEDLVGKINPRVTVQLEGRSMLEGLPKDGVYYHVSEDANIDSRGWTVEAEQGFLPFRDQSVDLVILNHTVELYQEARALFKEVERVLSPEGKVFMVVLVDRWLGAKIATKYYPLGNIRIQPQSLRKIKQYLGENELGIWEQCSLMSDPQAVMMSQRLKETLIYPMGLEIARVSVEWNNAVGAL